MRILLVGEFSNVHWTLAQGLRSLGHEVFVASDGDSWKNYSRDIDLKRHSCRKWDSLKFFVKLQMQLPKMRGFDVVQIINPIFFPLKAQRMYYYYRYLRRHNKKVFLGAFGMDYYWVRTCLDCKTFRYSDFNLGDNVRESDENTVFINDWLHGEKGKLNQLIAKDCDGIIAGLYEYYCCYQSDFASKLQYIPFPIALSSAVQTRIRNPKEKIRFFIGVQKMRNEYKGTDVMLSALERLEINFPKKVEVCKVISVPYLQYVKMMQQSDVLLDQLYSYTPAMNALQAMAQGLVVVGGGEEEFYQLMGEEILRPIVNVNPTEESVYQELKKLVDYPNLVEKLSRESIEFIRKYHDCEKVARQYLDFWNSH